MKFRMMILALFTLLSIQPAFAAKPIEDLVDVPIPARVDNSRMSLEDVKEAIIAGCRYKGWYGDYCQYDIGNSSYAHHSK